MSNPVEGVKFQPQLDFQPPNFLLSTFEKLSTAPPPLEFPPPLSSLN